MFDLVWDGGRILELRWSRYAVIDSADAEGAVAMVDELCGETEYPLLVDMATTVKVSRDARLVFARGCKATPIALLGASPVDRVLANYVLAMDTTNRPKRFFTSKAEAVAWLTGVRLDSTFVATAVN